MIATLAQTKGTAKAGTQCIGHIQFQQEAVLRNAVGSRHPGVEVRSEFLDPGRRQGFIRAAWKRSARVFPYHQYRSVIKLDSLGFGMARSGTFQRPPRFDSRREPTDAMRIQTAKLPQD